MLNALIGIGIAGVLFGSAVAVCLTCFVRHTKQNDWLWKLAAYPALGGAVIFMLAFILSLIW